MRSTHRAFGTERGLTLIEMLIAMTVFTIVIGGALSFMRQQSVGFRLGSDKFNTLQNLRYAVNSLELELRTVGSNVPDAQPFLIYADEDVVAFNADYATNLADDPWAVYYDADAPAGTVMALQRSGQITVPHTSLVYPDTSYEALGGGQNSPAETIIFWFEPDTSTVRGDDYFLYRQVNGDPEEIVSRNLLQTPGLPFFEYFWIRKPPSLPVFIQQVPAASLPLQHTFPIHGGSGDTASAAQIDSLRGIQVNFTVTNGLTGTDERQRSITRLIRLPNAGFKVKRSCGDEPILGVGLTAIGTATPSIDLSWAQAVDEAGGEEDVTRYALYKRVAGALTWGDPFLSLPAGQSSYAYQDLAVNAGEQWQYALAAQDCTPTNSPLAATPVITVP